MCAFFSLRWFDPVSLVWKSCCFGSFRTALVQDIWDRTSLLSTELARWAHIRMLDIWCVFLVSIGYDISVLVHVLKRHVSFHSTVDFFWGETSCAHHGFQSLASFANPVTSKDTNAWICARTTSTWWLYKKLAWYMPYHVEHHAWPNVPFHKLQAAHELVKDVRFGLWVRFWSLKISGLWSY